MNDNQNCWSFSELLPIRRQPRKQSSGVLKAVLARKVNTSVRNAKYLLVTILIFCYNSHCYFYPSASITNAFVAIKSAPISAKVASRLLETKQRGLEQQQHQSGNEFEISCRSGNVKEAYHLLEQNIYCYSSSSPQGQYEQKKLLQRDIHALVNVCTLPKKTSNFKIEMANRVLHLHHRLGSTPKENAIALSMILRACASLQQVDTIHHIYSTVFLGNSSGISSPSPPASIPEIILDPNIPFEKDIILCNCMLDSLLLCQLHAQAYQMFHCMCLSNNTTVQPRDTITITFTLQFSLGVSKETAIGLASTYYSASSLSPSTSYDSGALPRPNQRTYNIFLKGLTLQLKKIRSASTPGTSTSTIWGKIQMLSQYMKTIGMWDAITTNTLVNAYVTCQKFKEAELLLLQTYANTTTSKGHHHPNIEAYTDLYAGYAKFDYEKAKKLLSIMKSRSVTPNLFTYTAILQSMARQGEYQQMKLLLKEILTTNNKKIKTNSWNELYNAVFTGLLLDTNDDDDYETRIQCATKLFHGLFVKEPTTNTTLSTFFRPNQVLVLCSILFQGLARYCSRKSKELALMNSNNNNITMANHLTQQKRLLDFVKLSSKIHEHLFKLGYIFPGGGGSSTANGNIRINTPLMTIYASIQDLEKVKSCFLSIERKDVKSLNSYLDACIKCNSLMDSLEAFQQYVMRTPDAVAGANNITGSDVLQNYVRPDVVTYTILITSILKSATTKTNRNYAATLLQQTTNKTKQEQVETASHTVATATKRAQILYDDMLLTWNIIPDKALIDCIVHTMCNRPFFDSRVVQSSAHFSNSDDGNPKTRVLVLKLLKQVLLDAQKYNCYTTSSNLESNDTRQKQREVKNEYEALVNRVKRCAEIERALRGRQMEQLFRDKGWNEVDSSFRIFGGPQRQHRATAPLRDDGYTESIKTDINENGDKTKNRDWLESKGWNDVDSGFRII